MVLIRRGFLIAAAFTAAAIVLLSLCLSGRNDNYGFNFKRRFVQSMNFLAWSARKAGVEKQIEVVFADWNSEIPLSRVIRLSDGAAKMVRFLEIPPDLAARYNPSFSPFSQSVAFNAALRRAKGAYLGMMPADILLTSYALRNLIGILSGTIPVSFDPRAAVISVPRKNIPFYAEEAHDFSSPEPSFGFFPGAHTSSLFQSSSTLQCWKAGVS